MKLFKACQNDNCDNKHKILNCKITDKYCIKCGSRMAHVCYKCGAVLDSDLEKLCPACLEKIEQFKQKTAEGFVGGANAVAHAGPVLVGIVLKLVPTKNPVHKTLNVVDKVVNKK